jgi:hypothetical protein
MSSAELDPTGLIIARSLPTSLSSGQGSESSWKTISNKLGTSFGSSSVITEGKDFLLKENAFTVEMYVNDFN